jgi:serine-type D-Ala-D-Ala carboxypeptidase (penicillin-binding protein 5/6)
MSTNPQITTEGRTAVRGPRRWVLALAVTLALLPTASGGSVAASAEARVGVAVTGTGGAPATGSRPGAAAFRPAAASGAGAASPGPEPARQGAVAAPKVAAQAAVLADEATGQVLFERNARAGRAMASTTKVMTALLSLERLDERRVVVIGVGPTRVGEESLQLRRGERLTVRQLLLGLLLKSANDAGVALAEAVDGSEAAFVRRMNRKAAALGLTATHYVTPYGLDRPGHQTSARDLARLWEVAMRRADFRSLVATRSARIPGVPLSLRRFITTNQLLGSYRWTVGGKTGFTNRAGRCLVASATRGGRRLVAVALGSPNAFADVRAMFEHGFSKYARVRLAGRGQPVSPAAGRPAAYQTEADADALVRLDQLDQVRLALTPPSGQAAPASGGSGGAAGTTSAGAGAGATGGGSGGGAGATGGGSADRRGAATGWFVAGARRLAQVRLGPLPPTGIAPSATPAPTTSPAAGTPGPAATLTVGAPVQVGPVPPGAAAPAIDPFLRRAPP